VKLYSHALSPFSAKVRIALDEKSIPCEEVSLPIRRAGIVEKPRELLEINPRGEVPVLVDGDLRLYDSTVILEYLEDRYPKPPLYPADVAVRARARQLEDMGDWMLGGCVAALLAETFRKPDPAERDASRIAAAAEAIRRAYDRLEAALGGPRPGEAPGGGRSPAEGEHLCGRFGVADIACLLPVSFAAFYGVAPGEAHPRLAAWLSRSQARPSVAREVASMTEALGKLED
jgi:glutathione S-transferase